MLGTHLQSPLDVVEPLSMTAVSPVQLIFQLQYFDFGGSIAFTKAVTSPRHDIDGISNILPDHSEVATKISFFSRHLIYMQ